MATVKDSDLSLQTVTYNGVTIGGSTAEVTGSVNPYTITAPEFSLSGTYEYDDAGRAVKYTRYVLNVSCIVIGTSAENMSMQIDAIRARLGEPFKVLKMRGMGVGFGTGLKSGQVSSFGIHGSAEADLAWGPRPLRCDAAPVGGTQAWELLWSVEFRVSDCEDVFAGTPVPMVAFNYSTAWAIDIQGLERRTISGYIEIAINRSFSQNDQPTFTADSLRGKIDVRLPANFVRKQRAFSESADKSRLNFVIVDERLESDEGYPRGIIEASGSYGVATQGIGMAKGQAQMSMTLKTAPNVPRSRAGLVFWQSVMARQQELAGAMKSEGSKVAVFIDQLSMSHRLWSRESTFNVTWQLSGCMHDILFKSGVWTPVPNTDYTQWRASVEHLWRVGTGKMGTVAANDVVIDVCNQPGSLVIGASPDTTTKNNGKSRFKFSCQDIEPAMSWLAYDVNVSVIREENIRIHKKAVSNLSAGETVARFGVGGLIGAAAASYFLPGQTADPISPGDQDVHEKNSVPTTRVLLKFKAMRVKFKPQIPEIKTIGGHPVTQVRAESDPAQPKVVGMFADCPIYFARSTVEYFVKGYIPDVDELADPTLCLPDGKAGTI